MHRTLAFASPDPGYTPPSSAGRGLRLGLCILAGHALVLWAWLALRGPARWQQVQAPLTVNLMPMQRPEAASLPALPLPRSAAPTPPLPMPAAPIVVAASPSAGSIDAEPAPSPVAVAVATAQPAPAAAMPAASAAMPTPVQRPPAQIPPSDVQYLEPPRLVYPRASVRNGERGRVTVRVFIDSRGWPQQVEVAVSSGFARLDEAAVAAVRQARFKPYEVDGIPVAGWALVPADFDA